LKALKLSSLGTLTPKTNPGLDEMANTFLKECKVELLCPLTHLFNKSVAEGEFHTCPKKAKVIHLHKKGDKKHGLLETNLTPLLHRKNIGEGTKF
jgi:hypothetical protein